MLALHIFLNQPFECIYKIKFMVKNKREQIQLRGFVLRLILLHT